MFARSKNKCRVLLYELCVTLCPPFLFFVGLARATQSAAPLPPSVGLLIGVCTLARSLARCVRVCARESMNACISLPSVQFDVFAPSSERLPCRNRYRAPSADSTPLPFKSVPLNHAIARASREESEKQRTWLVLFGNGSDPKVFAERDRSRWRNIRPGLGSGYPEGVKSP